MAPVFVHRFSLAQQVCSENLDFLVSNTQVSFRSAQLRALGLDAFGLPVDPVLLGLDVLRSVSSGRRVSSGASRALFPELSCQQRMARRCPFQLSSSPGTATFSWIEVSGEASAVSFVTLAMSAFRTTPPISSAALLGRTIRPRSVPLIFHTNYHINIHTNCHMIQTNQILQHCTMRTSDQKENKGFDTESGVQQVLAKPALYHEDILSQNSSLSLSIC